MSDCLNPLLVIKSKLAPTWSRTDFRRRGESGDDFRDVEGHLSSVASGVGLDPGHIARPGPAQHIIFHETAEAATGNDDFETRLERSGEEGIVAAEGMADDSYPLGIHFW